MDLAIRTLAGTLQSLYTNSPGACKGLLEVMNAERRRDSLTTATYGSELEYGMTLNRVCMSSKHTI
jgi:hypothetical protein